jgi:hypothetical protein
VSVSRTAWWVVALCCVGCGGVGRQRTSFPVTVSASSSVGLVTDSGWTVQLTRARASFDAVRFFEGKVVLARARPWWRGLIISEAWAHPGHYVPGEALGELVAPLEVDLLGGPVTWGEAQALTGEHGSMQLTFASGGVDVAGTATKDGQSVAFTAQFVPPIALEGIRAEHEVSLAGVPADVQLNLGVLLSRIDFALSGASTAPLDPKSPAFNGLARGIEDTSSYLVTWKEGP